MNARRFWLVSAMMAAASLLSPDAAFAVGPEAGVRTASLPAERFGLDTGRPTLAPFAHVVFCKRYPEECRADAGTRRHVTLTPDSLKILRRVNERVNGAIRPREDSGGPLGDTWTLAPKWGDCDDYAVTKRSELARLGFPVQALRVAVTKTRAGEGHAVLLVRTDGGDLVLDNLTSRIHEWRDSGLSLVKLQVGADPKRWVSQSGERLSSNR